MSEVGFRIKESFERPPAAMVERLARIPVSNIDDCLNRMSGMDCAIRPYSRAKVAGPAFTVRAPIYDNVMFQKALGLAQPGDVLVIAAGGGMARCVCGEIMILFAKEKGLAGVIVDGCIRDAQSIAQLDFPVYARGISPNGPYKNGPGEIGFPVSFGGQVVFPGDIILGDGDGLIVVRPQEAPLFLEEAEGYPPKEERMMREIREGRGMDHTWLNQLLEEKGCRFL